MSVGTSRIDGLKVARARLALPQENGRHVSQAKIADRTGMHVVTISNIERGAVKNTTIDTLGKLAQALNVQIVDLLADHESQPESDDEEDEETDTVRDLVRALGRYFDHHRTTDREATT